MGFVDSDTLPDLVITNTNDNELYIFNNRGGGIFGPATYYNYYIANYPVSSSLADFNGDGYADLAISCLYDSVSVIMNDGTGNFLNIVNYLAGSSWVLTPDLNKDGKMDIVSYGNLGVYVMLGNGTGSFSPAVNYSHNSSNGSITCADFNKDGYQDVVVASVSGSNMAEITVMLNTGTNGTLSAGVHYPVGGVYLYGITSGDYNSDGNLDIAVTDNSNGVIFILENNGSAVFSVKAGYTVGQNPYMAESADFNKDGVDDIAIGSDIPGLTFIYSTNPAVVLTNTVLACTASPATLNATGAATYTWSTSQTGSSISVSPAMTSTYSVIGVDSRGCMSAPATTTVNIVAGCVWPGDANEDLIADNNDLLAVGLKFGKTGPSRSSVSNSWQGYMCPNWNDTLPGGINTRYVDCNGDSTVNFSDTLAINLNYGQAHAAREALPHPQSSNPDVYLTFSKPLYYPGDTVLASVNIGNSLNTQSNFYGAVFGVHYDNSKVKSGSEQFYFNDSWVGKVNQRQIKIGKIFPSLGKVDAGLVRITHTDTNGFGKVATLRFILRDTLIGNELFFLVTNGVKINSQGAHVNLNTGTDSVAITQGVGIRAFSVNNTLSVYPNPATDVITISSLDSLGMISVDNSLGETVLQMKGRNKEEKIDIGHLQRGIYIIHLQGKNIKLVKE